MHGQNHLSHASDVTLRATRIHSAIFRTEGGARPRDLYRTFKISSNQLAEITNVLAAVGLVEQVGKGRRGSKLQSKIDPAISTIFCFECRVTDQYTPCAHRIGVAPHPSFL